jgi:paired amphipathic helix protein Sin3a
MQREWDKVWRDLVEKNFWKSLDHQVTLQKNSDKKQFQTKTIQNEIQVKYEEQKRLREIMGQQNVPRYQMEIFFDDSQVILDACRLIVIYLRENYPSSECSKTINFLKEFASIFFGIDISAFDERIRDSGNQSPAIDLDDERSSREDGTSPRPSKVNGKKQTSLIRRALDVGKRGKGDSAPASRASTPDIQSGADEDMTGVESQRPTPPVEITNNRWLDHPDYGNGENDLKPDEPYERDVFNFYADLNIYCMFRMFVYLYERLRGLKQNEATVQKTVQTENIKGENNFEKPAISLRMMHRLSSDYFQDTSPTASYYEQVLVMFEDVMKGEIEPTHVEDTLRRYYLEQGWLLYSFDKLIGSLVKYIEAVRTNDSSGSYNLYGLFKKDRMKTETTYNMELAYRKSCDKFIKGGDTYRISFHIRDMKAQVRVFKKEDLTIEKDNLSLEQAWRYYVSSYGSVDPTENIRTDKVQFPFLKSQVVDEDDETYDSRSNVQTGGALAVRIRVRDYEMNFDKNSYEWLLADDQRRSGGKDGLKQMEEAQAEASERAQEKLVLNNRLMKDISKETIEQWNSDFRTAFDRVPEIQEDEVDVAMDDV